MIDYHDESRGITLHSGDALDVLPTIPRAGCVIVDPPYAMTPNSVRGRDDGAAGTSATPVRLVTETFRHVYRMLPDGGCAFVFCDWRRGPDTTYLAVLAGLRVATCIAWTRNRPGTGGMFRSAWDPIYVVSKGSPTALDRAAIPNVVEAEYPARRSHPYEKPAKVWDHLLGRLPPTTVVDPFAGSCGSADVAIRHGHRWVGIEVDDLHRAAAIQRWESELRYPATFADIIQIGLGPL